MGLGSTIPAYIHVDGDELEKSHFSTFLNASTIDIIKDNEEIIGTDHTSVVGLFKRIFDWFDEYFDGCLYGYGDVEVFLKTISVISWFNPESTYVLVIGDFDYAQIVSILDCKVVKIEEDGEAYQAWLDGEDEGSYFEDGAGSDFWHAQKSDTVKIVEQTNRLLLFKTV